jgi:oligopeptide transport system substrate-binding protein
MKWLAVLFGVLILAAVALFFISGGQVSDSTTDDPQNTAVLRFASGNDHHFLDPQRMTWLHDIRIAECLFETLLKRDGNDWSLIPGVAQRWTVSDDQRTYTFHLRPDAAWSNGDPVRADDFVYAWRRALTPDLAADYSQLLFSIKGAKSFFDFRNQQLQSYAQSRQPEPAAMWKQAQDFFAQHVGVRAVDERTLVVELEQLTPFFLELCAFPTFTPIHAASLERGITYVPESGMRSEPDDWLAPGKLVSNGPYVLAAREFRQSLRMTANPHYWDRGNVGVTVIEERIIDNPQTALLAYQNDEVDWLPDLPTASSVAADLSNQKRPDVHLVPAAGLYFYNFNCQPTLPDGSKNPLHDARVRRALAMAIDRQTLVAQVTRLNQPIARSFVPPDAIREYTAPVEDGATFDPSAARALLAEAGYARGQDVQGLSILYNTGMGHENVAQQIQRTWSEVLGVSVKLEAQESRVFGDRLRKCNYVIARASWFGDYRDPTTFLDKFRTTNGNNDARWSDPEFDKLMAQSDAEPDAARRMALLRQAESLMLRQQPIAPIYQYINLHVFNPSRVQNLNPNAWNFRRLDLVRVTR